jgi:hypothetical protein
MYRRTAGKNGKQAPVIESDNVSSLSNLGLQVFEHIHGPNFRSFPSQTATFTTTAFSYVPSFSILTILPSHPITKQGMMLVVSAQDAVTFRKLNDKSALSSLKQAMGKFSARKKKNADLDED